MDQLRIEATFLYTSVQDPGEAIHLESGHKVNIQFKKLQVNNQSLNAPFPVLLASFSHPSYDEEFCFRLIVDVDKKRQDLMFIRNLDLKLQPFVLQWDENSLNLLLQLLADCSLDLGNADKQLEQNLMGSTSNFESLVQIPEPSNSSMSIYIQKMHVMIVSIYWGW